MTGNEIGERVVGNGIANRPGCPGEPTWSAKVLVGGDLTRRQAQERLPDFDLEVGAAQVKWDGHRGRGVEDFFDEGGGARRVFGKGGIGPGLLKLFEGGVTILIHESQEADAAPGDRQ